MNLLEVPIIPGIHYITTEAENEIRSSSSRQIFELFKEGHDLSVVDPDPKYISQVDEVCKKIGQKGLSMADVSILALFLMLSEIDDITLISDDYALRNVAHAKHLPSKGYKTKGGEQFRKYVYYCEACNAKYKEVVDECDICGHTKFRRSRK